MTLELNDMQGLLVRGFGNLQGAQYLLLRFTEAERSRKYIKELLPLLTNALQKPDDHAVQLAFTYEGLSFLALPDETLQSFSREFKEGMTEPHRQFVLGDTGENTPENWVWGSKASGEIHLLLMIYSHNAETLAQKLVQEEARAEAYGLDLLHSLPTGMLHDHKEHFGFRDDISRPIIQELNKKPTSEKEMTFPAGEFIMGYKNLYDEFAPSPVIPPEFDKSDDLPDLTNDSAFKDFGKNGTYLVFRQMEQDVFAFWEYLLGQSKSKEEAIRLASKMVGRWPDGSPLTKTPDKNDPDLSTFNDFAFWEEDKWGLKCPIGAHIRRTNPRDHLVTEKTQKDSAEMASKHRMLRKGRPYGEPVCGDLEPSQLMELPRDHKERGLHFICLVTDIRRQFEFIQNNWVNFHKFGGLEYDADPLIGNHYKNGNIKTDEFSIPEYPIRRKLCDLPNFTLMKGGGYFFFPGISAVRFLANYD
ncbi:Dyp-type peroxidase [Negadavirga shengliensis]|uniref:Dyp-type peroxidase n=1 Tax=Negadavirga shengliensis TaxID=1389218 RepID=A0ABV9SZD1_9BACT